MKGLLDVGEPHVSALVLLRSSKTIGLSSIPDGSNGVSTPSGPYQIMLLHNGVERIFHALPLVPLSPALIFNRSRLRSIVEQARDNGLLLSS